MGALEGGAKEREKAEERRKEKRQHFFSGVGVAGEKRRLLSERLLYVSDRNEAIRKFGSVDTLACWKKFRIIGHLNMI